MMDKNWFKQLRERQAAKAFEKDLEKARAEGFAEGQHRAYVLARVEWAVAQLSLAEQSNDLAFLAKACRDSLAVLAELDELNRASLASAARLQGHVDKLRKPEVN